MKNTVKTVLLKAWLKRMDGDFLKLLESLDLNVDCIELITKVLMSLFEYDLNNFTLLHSYNILSVVSTHFIKVFYS